MSLRVLAGDDVKRLRKNIGMTQKELAKKSGVSQSLVARIESGSVDPRLSTLNRIFNALTGFQTSRTAANVMHEPVISVDVSDTVKHAVELMEKHGISQMPVLENGKVIGSIQEATLIRTILNSSEPNSLFESSLQGVMEESFPMVSPTASVDEVFALLAREKPAVLVLDKGKICGIITKIDVIASVRPKAHEG